jgi:CBS domain-containing protein
MRATDVMVHDVATVHPETDLADAINLLADRDVSVLPVVDAENHLIGILSEADLVHRFEISTEKRRPWWLEAVTGASTLAQEFAKSHGEKVAEVMTSDVVSVGEETPLSEVASLLERKRIKRVPVMRDGKLVGVVSQSNLVQALALSSAEWSSLARATVTSASTYCRDCTSNPGPILAAATLRFAMGSCISGGWSDRLPNERRCWRLRKASPV